MNLKTNSLEEVEEFAIARASSPRHNLKYILYGEAVKRQDYNLPELALSDRAHQKTLSSAIAPIIPCKSKINPSSFFTQA